MIAPLFLFRSGNGSIVLLSVSKLLDGVLFILIAVVLAEAGYCLLNDKVRRVLFGVARHKFLIVKVSVTVGDFYNILKIPDNFGIVRGIFYGIGKYFPDIFLITSEL